MSAHRRLAGHVMGHRGGVAVGLLVALVSVGLATVPPRLGSAPYPRLILRSLLVLSVVAGGGEPLIGRASFAHRLFTKGHGSVRWCAMSGGVWLRVATSCTRRR